MSNVSEITKSLRSLRIKSEANRAARAATGNRQNAGRVAPPPPGGRVSPAKAKEKDPIRRIVSEERSVNTVARLGRANTVRGGIGKVATRLTGPVLVNNVNTTIRARTREITEKNLLPYRNEMEPHDIPVVTSVAHRRSDKPLPITMEATMTEYGPGVIMRGEEYLSSASTSSNTYTPGNAIVGFPINPRVLTTPRLRSMARLYTRFIFKRLELIYEHTAGAQNNGSIQMFGVYDPTTNPCMKPGDALKGYAYNRGASTTGVFEDQKLVMDDKHFKDLLFLQPDDDLRWSMQGIIYVTTAGTIATSLEMGDFKIVYEVVLANDDLDEDEVYETRSYSGALTVPTGGWTAGGIVTFNNNMSLPAGAYWVTARADPTTAFSVWKDLNAYQTNETNELYQVAKGSGFYLLVPNSGSGVAYANPDLFGEEGIVNDKHMVSNAVVAAGVSTACQLLRLSF